MLRFALALLVGLLAFPAGVRAECPPGDKVADNVFGHAYGEPSSAPCRDDAPREVREHPSTKADAEFRDEHPEERHSLRTIGFTGIGTGSTLAGLGGGLLLGSLFTDPAGTPHAVLHNGGLGLVIGGGAVVLAGVVLLGIDAIAAPAPTHDGRGAQLMVAFRF